MPDTKVRIQLQGDTETKKRWLNVGVASNVKKDHWASKQVPIEDVDGETVKRDVQAAAEACAVYQCRVLGDMHDPQSAGKAALEALDDLKRRAVDAREGRGRGR